MVDGLVAGGLKYNTHRTYSSAQKQYLDFCSKYGLIPLPADENQILRYIAYMSRKPGRKGESLGVYTMNVYLAAVRSLHVMHNLPPPPRATPKIQLALKSVSFVTPPPSQKEALSYQCVCLMIQLLPLDSQRDMWCAALLLGYSGGLRGSEYTAVYDYKSKQLVIPPPKVQSLEFALHEGIKYMIFTVVASKTTIHPFKKFIACSNSAFCPVCIMHKYLSVRSSTGLLRPDQPLLVHQNGLPLAKHELDSKIKDLVCLLGFDPTQFTTHSLRAGAISAGHAAGLSEKDIASIGNHKSDAYKAYIRFDVSHALKISKTLFS